jgi:aryl-alcohol dehydrogenase-like predicted oxidoreductase
MELRGAGHQYRNTRPIDPAQSKTILNLVLDSGINYIDTSIDYGVSEESIGSFISHRRDEYFLASKCGCWVGEPPAGLAVGERIPHVFTRENIVAGVEQSLRRMKTDHLDLVQFHSSPSREVLEQEGAITTLRDLQSQGKIRFIGSSSTLPNLLDLIDLEVFDVFQIPYSALEREHEEAISTAANAGVGTVIRGGVAKGAPGEGTGTDEVWHRWDDAKLDEIAEGMSRTEFMLRFTLSHPGLTTTIVGTMNPTHLAQNIEVACKGPLPDEIYTETKDRLSALDR